MWILFFLTLSGHLFGLRTIKILHKRGWLSEKKSAILVLVQYFGGLICAYALFSNPNWWFLVAFSQGLAVFVPILIFKIKYSRFEKQIPYFLDQLIIQVGIGRSLRQALDAEKKSGDKTMLFFIEECLASLQLNRFSSCLPRSYEAHFIGEQIIEIAKGQFKTLERLKSLRSFLKLQRKLKRRSDSALAQARAQGLVLGFFYLVALVWYYHCEKKIDLLVLLSLSLMAFGQLMVWRLGRAFSWSN